MQHITYYEFIILLKFELCLHYHNFRIEFLKRDICIETVYQFETPHSFCFRSESCKSSVIATILL